MRGLKDTVSLLSLLLFASSPVFAQAWVFPKGGGTVTASYQNIFVRDHLFQDGDAHDTGHILSHAVYVDTDYSLTDRLAVKVGLPYAAGRYYGPRPHVRTLADGRSTTIDDGTYHSTFQDFVMDVRYNVASHPLVFTPFFRTVVPSHDYEYFAHSAVGRDQRQYQFGANIGRRLDPILPKAYVQARYSFAFVERVLGIAANHSDTEFQIGYFLKPRLTIVGSTQWMHTHNGSNCDYGLFHCGFDDLHWIHHDQILKSTLLDAGGAVAYSLNSSTEVFVSVARSVTGTNGHFHASVATIGITRSFGTRFAVDRSFTKSGPAPAPETAFVCTCVKSK
jgi:hypothetical protein